MKNKTKLIKLKDGSTKREPEDMYDLLNYNVLKLLNKAQRKGLFDMPVLHCDIKVFPDYIALYNQKSLYTKTPLTSVSFYNYDNEFDGENGLYNAIKYNKVNKLNEYKDRFKDVNYIISPDYTMFGDIHKIINLNRVLKARIVSLWFTMEMGKVVIPNISYFDEEWLPFCLDGLEECNTLAISAKGHIDNPNERELFRKVIKYVANNLPKLENIVVYSVCKNDGTVLESLMYATQKGINVVIPDNTLRHSNMKRGDNYVGR